MAEPQKQLTSNGIEWVSHFAGFATLSAASVALPFIPELGVELLAGVGLSGAVGAGLGALTRAVLARVTARQQLVVGTVVVPVIVWLVAGAVVQLADWAFDPNLYRLARPSRGVLTFIGVWGGSAAALQTVWFVPSSLLLRRQGESGEGITLFLAPVVIWFSLFGGYFVTILIVSTGVAWLG